MDLGQKKVSYQQSLFTPKNPSKYKGNLKNIRCLSSWEEEFNKFLDGNPNILEWSSEPFAIKYLKPTDKKIHRYYPDYWIKYRDKHGKIIQEIIEIKPEKQTKPPTLRGKRRKHQVYEALTYAVNIAKWKAANEFCSKHNIKFRIVTEKQLFGGTK